MMPMAETSYRRHHLWVSKLEVGTSASGGQYAQTKSAFEVEWTETSPWVKVPIPGADNAVYQHVKNPDLQGMMSTLDLEAAYQLFYNTDVDGVTAGNQYAVSSTGRTTIDYCKMTVTHQKVTINDESVDDTKTATFTFTNMRIGEVRRFFTEFGDRIELDFTADSVSESWG